MELTRRNVAMTIAGAAAIVIANAPVYGQDVIRVGAPLPLTGPLSPEGIKQQRGYDLWAETANAKGGIKAGGKNYKVELVYVDYASNTPRAVQTAERLITENKVNFLFSPFGSGAAKAASGVSEKYGIPTIAATASSEQVYDQGYKFLFGTFTPNSTLTEPLAAIVSANKSIKRIAILARNDLFPLAIAQEMEKSAKARNIEVATFERYAIGSMDHAAAITQMRAANPDWVFATGYINDLILIRKQMADLGLRPQVVTMIAGPAYKEFIEASGPLAENVSSAAWWHPAVRYNGKDVFGTTEAFNAAWQKKYNSDPDYAEASAAAAGAILQLAIEAANAIDPAKVRDALAAIDVETFYGKVKFGATGQIISLEPPVFQIQGGRPTVIYPTSIKQADFKCMGQGTHRGVAHGAAPGAGGGGATAPAAEQLAMIYLQILANGLVLGALYACISVGFSLVWGVLNVINILHGTFIVLGSYVAYFAYAQFAIHPFVSVVLAGCLLYVIGYVLQAEVINRVIAAPVLITLTLTFGLDLILNNAMLVAFTADYRKINLAHPLGSIEIGPIFLPGDRVAAMVLALLLTVLLHRLLRDSRIGRAIVAVRMDREAAMLMGVDVKRINAVTFGIGALMAGAAGALLSIVYPISPLNSSLFLGKAFVVCVLGGLGSVPGAMVGGLVLGVVESFGAFWFGPEHAVTLSFGLLLVLLFVRPSGLLGKRGYE